MSKLAVVSRKTFRVTACIDWLDVTIETSRPTQHHHLQQALRINAGSAGATHWVEAVDKQPGNVGTVFRIRFHDVDDYARLANDLAKLSVQYPFVAPPKVAAIEVACDFRHKAGSIPETLAMTHRLQSSLFVNGNRPRQYDPHTGKMCFLDHRGDRLDPNLCFYVGNRYASLSWRSYFKTFDKKQPLPEKQWRARIEVTLQGHAPQKYALNLVSDLETFRFDKLAELFRFRRPVAPEQMAGGDKFRLAAIKTNRELHDATPERGMHSFDAIGKHDKFRKTRAVSSHLEADDELRNAVKGALRRLTL